VAEHHPQRERLALRLGQLVEHWRSQGEYTRIKVLELLFVKGWPNHEVAAFLKVSEQQVANIRFAAVKKVTEQIRHAGLPADVVSSWVDMTGPWTGTVVLTTGARTAVELTEALLGATAPPVLDDEDVADALGELANVVGGNVKQAPNVATLVPKLEEATYLLGMAAGGLTKSNVIGAVGGMKLPVISSTFQAFEAGAKAVNPKVRILTSYVGNFEDQNAAKEATRAMLAQRADFVFHNADQAGKGMFNAAQEASGVLVFGSNRNQNSVAPTVCLASAVIEMPRAFVQLARAVQQQQFKADFIELNLKTGTIAVEWNAALKGKVPPPLMQKINRAEQQIKSGGIKIKRNV